jgi:hypothetical protein
MSRTSNEQRPIILLNLDLDAKFAMVRYALLATHMSTPYSRVCTDRLSS